MKALPETVEQPNNIFLCSLPLGVTGTQEPGIVASKHGGLTVVKGRLR